jgi:hypothetical protein
MTEKAFIFYLRKSLQKSRINIFYLRVNEENKLLENFMENFSRKNRKVLPANNLLFKKLFFKELFNPSIFF